jgi:hypothetical protein
MLPWRTVERQYERTAFSAHRVRKVARRGPTRGHDPLRRAGLDRDRARRGRPRNQRVAVRARGRPDPRRARRTPTPQKTRSTPATTCWRSLAKFAGLPRSTPRRTARKRSLARFNAHAPDRSLARIGSGEAPGRPACRAGYRFRLLAAAVPVSDQRAPKRSRLPHRRSGASRRTVPISPRCRTACAISARQRGSRYGSSSSRPVSYALWCR